MTKKSRIILFSICLILFFLITPPVIFYSQGYRFDFSSKKFSQTGGLFFKVKPKQAKIYINGKLKKKTDFFFGSALIENLLPKKYKIQIKKQGFHPWEKTLEIKEKEVTAAKNIVLIPENPDFNILTTGVKDFWFSPDQKKIILEEINSSYNKKKTWALKLYDLERKVKSHLVDEHSFISNLSYPRVIEEKGISPQKADLFSLKFSPDSKTISLEIGAEEKLHYFNLELDKVPPVLTETEKPSSPLSNSITSQSLDQDTYHLDQSGYLFKNEERLTKKPFPVKPETEYQLYIFPKYIFLRENKTLYWFNSDSGAFEKFYEPSKAMNLSPDHKKIVYFSDYEIWVLFLKEDLGQPKREKGEKLFLTRFSEKIGQVFWLNNHYLIFSVGDNLKISEIDNRDKINIVTLAKFKKPKIFLNQFDKKLYVLSEKNLYQSQSLD